MGQVFGETIGNRITVIPAVTNLWALEIDPQAAAQAYRDRIVGPVRGVLPDAVVDGIEESLSGACTTEIAAFDEFCTALLTDAALTQDYAHIIFDTAPTGHTIRLLQLPGAWSGFLEAGKGDASCLGPLAGLEKQRSQYKAAVEALADPLRTRMVLVARAGSAPRCARRHAPMKNWPPSACRSSTWSSTAYSLPEMLKTTRSAAAIYQESKPHWPPFRRHCRPCLGIRSRSSRSTSSASMPCVTCWSIPTPRMASMPSSCPTKSMRRTCPPWSTRLPSMGTVWVMVMGKGGVGKTTLAAAIAVELASRGLPVHLTTSDPAAHLADTLEGSLAANLALSRIDPQEATERYRQHVMDTKGAQLDAAGRALLEEDLRSPCTEEIAVFQAFSRAIREGSGSSW